MLQFRNNSDSKILKNFKERANKNNDVERDPHVINQYGWRVKDGLHVWVVVHDSNMDQWEIYNSAEGVMDCDPFKVVVKFDNEKISIICADDGGRKLKADRSLKKFMQLATYINCFYLTGFFQEEKTIKKYYDDFHNMATIEKIQVLPYYGATSKEDGYRLSIYALYDNDCLYHVSMHETEAEALEELNGLSCGSFKPEA